MFLELGIAKQELRRAIGEDLLVLCRGKAPVQRHEDRAEPRQREQQYEHFGVVVSEICDSIAFCHSKSFADEIDALPEIAVRPVLAFEVNGNLGRTLRRPALDDAREVQLSRPTRRARRAPRGRCDRGTARRSTAASTIRSANRGTGARAAAT